MTRLHKAQTNSQSLTSRLFDADDRGVGKVGDHRKLEEAKKLAELVLMDINYLLAKESTRWPTSSK